MFERVEQKANEHLLACMEAMDDLEVRSPAFAPFDGCDTCVVREVLMVAWDEMWKQAKVVIGAEYGVRQPSPE